MSTSDVATALRALLAVLDRHGVRFQVGGSVASSALGVARSTLDVDVVADLREVHARVLAEELAAAFYVDEDAIRRAIQDRSSFNLIHLETMLKVDVFVLKRDRWHRLAFDRGREVDIGTGDHFVVTGPEDTILHKLVWYRLGDEVSERQWGDVLGVLRVQGDALDDEYLDQWAEELGVSDLLARARAEA